MTPRFMAARFVGIIGLAMSVANSMVQSATVPRSLDPVAAIPGVKYESAFSDYQPFREQKVRSWKEANQEVADNPGMGSMGSMKDMPGMNKKGPSASMVKKGKGAMAVAKPNTGSGTGQAAGVMDSGARP